MQKYKADVDFYLNSLATEIVTTNKLEKIVQPDQICIDSRKIKKGDWYLPIIGENFDGHKFIQDALDKGAVGFFYQSERINTTINKNNSICVKSTIKSLQKIAKAWRAKFESNSKVVALTASNGKTTTKAALKSLINEPSVVLSFNKSFNNEMGVPLVLLQIKPEHKYILLEFGARNKGDIKFLTELANPDIVCVLNVGAAHLEVFKTYENILKTKTEIYKFASTNAVFVNNLDNVDLTSVVKEIALKNNNKVINFSLVNNNKDVYVKKQVVNSNYSTEIFLSINNKEYLFESPLVHEKLSINLAAACAMALALDIDINKMQSGFRGYKGVSGRFKTYKINNKIIIDDSYNANQISLLSGLETVNKNYISVKPAVVILGDMLELGDDSILEHKRIGTYISLNFTSITVISIGDLAKAITDKISKTNNNDIGVLHFANVKAVLENIDVLEKYKLIYLKGSNAMKLNLLVNKLLE